MKAKPSLYKIVLDRGVFEFTALSSNDAWVMCSDIPIATRGFIIMSNSDWYDYFLNVYAWENSNES